MSKFLDLTAAAALAAIAATPAMAEKLGLGRAALPEEIAAWNLDVRPDGQGLPEGSGDAIVGEDIFAEKCASCHGDFAEGVGNWPKLAGGMNTLNREDPLKTVGSYWPHVSTVWDYVNRSMPFGAAQTLEPDEVYAIVAYILYSNDLIEDEVVAVFTAKAGADLPIALNPEEAQAARWVPIEALLQEIAEDPNRFTPWLRIYLTQHLGQILGDL